MDKTRWIKQPQIVVIGHDAIFDIVSVLDELNLRYNSTLVVTGSTSKHLGGYKIAEIISESGDEVEIEMISKDDSESEIEIAKSLAESAEKFGLLIGAGGGNVIDITKLTATWLEIPFISVPTATSHDGIASPRSSIKRGDQRISIPAKPPIAIVADTHIISSAPNKLLAAGCGDAISNCTAVRDWELAYKLKNADYSEYAAALSRTSARLVLDNAEVMKEMTEKSVEMLTKALIYSGVAISIAGSSCPASGSEHKFSHALDVIAPQPALHGEQCGVGTIMMMYLHGDDWKLIRDSLEKIGAPINAKELGIEDEYLIKALCHAHEIKPERYTILGSGLTPEAAEKLATKTGVI